MQQADKKEAANRYGAYTEMTIFLTTGESIMSYDLQQQAIQLILSSLPDKFLPLFGPPAQAASVLRSCLQLEQSILLLQGQQLAGLLGYYHHRRGFLNLPTSALSMPVAPQQFYIEILCTAANFRQRGIGSILLQQAIHTARQTGCTTMALDVYQHNSTAIRLYRQNDFGITSRQRARPPLQQYVFLRMEQPV